MGDFIKSFISDDDYASLTTSTMKNYESVLVNFAKWLSATNGEEFIPHNITPLDIKEYKGYLKRIGRSPKTINRILVVIKKYCSWALTKNYIDVNPALGISGISQTKLAPQWLDRKEQFALIRELDKAILSTKSVLAYRNKAIVLLMLHAGLRVSEVCQLEKNDIDLTDRKGQVFIREGKGEKSRIVPLNKDARKALKEYLDCVGKTGKYLFYSQRGEQLSPRAIQHFLKEYGRTIKHNDTKKITPHKLRHTFCHNLIEQGITLDKVALLAGHITKDGLPNIKTTLIYTTPSQHELEKAVETLEWD